MIITKDYFEIGTLLRRKKKVEESYFSPYLDIGKYLMSNDQA